MAIEKRECVIRYGTPKPIAFHETMGTDQFDEVLWMRSYGDVHVSGFDTEKYKDEEELRQAIVTGMPELIEKCLKVMAEKSVMRPEPNSRLEASLKAELLVIGIEAEVEVLSFVLGEESEKKYKEMQKEIAKGTLEGLTPDRTDRPYVKPDCVPPPLMPIGAGIGGMMGTIRRDKFCRKCGKPIGNTGRFCGGCGAEIVVTFPAFASPAADVQPEPQQNPPRSDTAENKE